MTDEELHEKILNIIYSDLDPSVRAGQIITLVRDETALQLGRDVIKLGIVPFLERLVGEDDTYQLFARHAGHAGEAS